MALLVKIAPKVLAFPEQRHNIFIIEQFKGDNIIQRTVAFDKKYWICKVSTILHAVRFTLWTHLYKKKLTWILFYVFKCLSSFRLLSSLIKTLPAELQVWLHKICRNLHFSIEINLDFLFQSNIGTLPTNKCKDLKAKREMMSNETGESVDLLFESRDQLIVISGILIHPPPPPPPPPRARRQWSVGHLGRN